MTLIHTRRAHIACLAATLGLTAVGNARAADHPFDGTWTTILEAGFDPLTMRLVIENDVASLNISSANQGDARIPASQVSIDGERIRLTFKALNATFEGALNGNRYIDGVLIQGRSYQMRFTRGQVAEGLPHSTWAPLTPELLNHKRIVADIPAMGAAWSRGKKSALFVKGVRSSDATIAVKPDDQWHWDQ